jgi:hypothetical protein
VGRLHGGHVRKFMGPWPSCICAVLFASASTGISSREFPPGMCTQAFKGCSWAVCIRHELFGHESVTVRRVASNRNMSHGVHAVPVGLLQVRNPMQRAVSMYSMFTKQAAPNGGLVRRCQALQQ